MKTKALTIIAVILFSVTQVFAEGVTKKIKVAGNCGMCETRIENAALKVKGVETADWDKESKMLEVKFDEEKTSIKKIQEAMAKVGHDTETAKASDKVYEKLPACCKYDRITEAGCGQPCGEHKEAECGHSK